jgi:hypothetical protein
MPYGIIMPSFVLRVKQQILASGQPGRRYQSATKKLKLTA